MTRLLVHVEGETEETFVNEILRPFLIGVGYVDVSARLLGNARARSRRGGIKAWATVKSDISKHLAGDQGCIATTMVDYYALPADPATGWPGRSTAPLVGIETRGHHVQEALRNDFSASPYSQRFEPFVLMHEFEALLFSDCVRFAEAIGHPNQATAFQAVRDLFRTPEHINDSPQTAPSKRVISIVNNYEKPLLGTLAALEIGIPIMRAQCPHFDTWLRVLESKI